MATNLERRTFVVRSSVAVAATLLSGGGASASTDELKSAKTGKPPSLFNLQQPQDNLDAFVKVMGDLSGEPKWISAQGRIYALRDGEMPLPILAMEGLRWVRFVKIDEGYRFESRDWAFYKDIHSGAVLDEFVNPITGKTNKTRHILTKHHVWTIGPNGQHVPGYTGEAWLIDRPFVLPWTIDGTNVSVPLELLVKYASGGAGGEWMNFTTSLDSLNDPNLTSVPSQHAWTGHSAWVSWMDMGDIAGRTLWQSTGQKHDNATDLRPEFHQAVDRYFPGSLARPESYEKTSYTLDTSGKT